MWIEPFAYLGTPEILMIVGVLVLLFGGAKIPQLARGMGEGIREFRKSLYGGASESAPATDGSDETTRTAAK